MSRNAQGVVAVLFVVFAISFIATTAVLFAEFRDHDWFTLAAFYSHLFIFFPTFGILALCAFFIPASALVDLYWNHVKYGRIRFVVATTVLAIASLLLAQAMVAGNVPAIWWLKPETLASDKGDPRGCGAASNACKRQSVMDSVAAVRSISQKRAGLSPFVRECSPDPLVEVAPELMQKRYCFVTKAMTTASECCRSQTVFTEGLSNLYVNEKEHSVTGKVHAVLLPLKIFFLFVILAIGILLALWRRTIDARYADYTGRIERGLLIGALAMLLWPISNHGFLQSSSLLYGKFGEGFYATLSPILSFVFIAWAMLLVLFFFRRHERDIEAAGKIGGGIASAVAIIKYNEIIDYATRFLGSGADPLELALLSGLLVTAFVALFSGMGSVGMPKAPATLTDES
jgi:hypothetical protein